MTNSHGYVLEYPRIRVDHFDQAPVPLPRSLLAHRRTVLKQPLAPAHDSDSLPFAPEQTHFDKPLLYLLTHIHTDHLKGLDRPGITAPIYCTAATKELLLKYERQKTRIEKDRDGLHSNRVGVLRPYAHLRVTDDHATARAKLSGYQSTSLDLLHPLPYNVPTKVQYTPTSSVTLTLIESNHMFGATMFLIQGACGAVLHTGDMRAEEWWCEALKRNPFLSPYLCWNWQDHEAEANSQANGHHQQHVWAHQIEFLDSTTSLSQQASDNQSQSQPDSQSQDRHVQSPSNDLESDSSMLIATATTKKRPQLRLRNIYLDTELLLCNQKVPTKQQACLDTITLMRLYPSTTVFFLNCWTWGYEDMLILTAKAFGCKIHVDRFKYIMYKAARCEAPFLADLVTQDSSKTRFHACERHNACSHVQGIASRYSSTADPSWAKEALAAHSQIDTGSLDPRLRWGPLRPQADPLLVYINPAQIAADKWPSMFQDTKDRLQAAQKLETAWPEALVMPIERHSTLPELQMFVGLFRPRTVSPNTILDPKGGLDYYLLHHLFGHLLAGADDRRKMAEEGVSMLGNKTWSFYEAQLARAREQAQANRAVSGHDSTEAVRATSGSINGSGHGESMRESLDAWQLDRLSKLRGINYKGLMMQNMAGNLAAMLEIERWRTAAGIQEPSEGLNTVIEQSLASTQGRSEASVSSVDYDADHSQFAETQNAPPPRFNGRGMHEDETTDASSGRNQTQHASDPVSQRSVCASSLITHDKKSEQALGASAPAEPSQHLQPSAAEVEEEDMFTELSEDLACRYLNVLIHHFHVRFHRTNNSYVQMWKTVRCTLAEEAQKVEEHWFRETGILPPLWSSQAVEAERAVPAQAAVRTSCDRVEAHKSSVLGQVLTSFIDMLAPAPAREHVELVSITTSSDHTVALQLIFRHFVKIGFNDPIESSADMYSKAQSHASCLANASTAEWEPLSDHLTALTRYLTSTLRSFASSWSNSVDQENRVLSLQLTGLLFSTRALHAVIDGDAIQMLLDSVISIVEAAPRDFSTLSSAGRMMTANACAVLRAEELEEHILAPFEHRLLALAHDSDGVLRRSETLMDEAMSRVGQLAPVHIVGCDRDAVSETDRCEAHDGRVGVDRTSQDEQTSSLPLAQIRVPRIGRISPSYTIQHRSPTRISTPHIQTADSVISTSQRDSIESSTASLSRPQEPPQVSQALQVSQASSVTQEEDETQSEHEALQHEALSAGVSTSACRARRARVQAAARAVVDRTVSLNARLAGQRVEIAERRKRGLDVQVASSTRRRQ